MKQAWPVNDAFRAAIFWSFNDEMEAPRLIRQMDALLAAGISPGFLHTRVGLVTPYLSPEWMDLVAEMVEAARERGETLWLYDEDRWPSGYGGGAVTLADPALAGGSLALTPEGTQDRRLIRVLGHCEQGGRRYAFAQFRERNGDSSWFGGGAYPDFLNPRAMDAFLAAVHERYRERIGAEFGKTVAGIFFDEPTYVRRGPYPSVPFTDGLPEAFEARYGYALLPRLRELFFDEGDFRRLRLDYSTLAAELFVDSFTKPYQRWCRDNHLLLTGHFVHEDTLTWQAEFTGAAMPHYPHMDIPGIDKLGLGNDKLMTVVQVTSVAEQTGRRSLCEALGCIGHQSGPEQMKSLTDWLASLGISFINPHLALYSMRGERKRDYPPNISWMQPWFGVSRPYWDHVARVSEAAFRGKSCADLLIIHPITSVWAEMSPLHKHHPVSSIWAPYNRYDRQNFSDEVELWEKPFMDLTERLWAQGLPHHYGDELILAERARVEDGRLIVGEMAYRTVIVPPVSVLRATTLALLKELTRQAGADAVVFMEKGPDWIAGGGEAGEIASWAAFAPDREQTVRHARRRSDPWIWITDAATGEISDKVFVNARMDGAAYHAFVANTDTVARRVRVHLRDGHALDLIDTLSGEALRVPAHAVTEDGFAVLLEAGGSLLLVRWQGEAPGREAGYMACGADFRRPGALLSVQRPDGAPSGGNVLPLDRVSLRAGGITVEDTPVDFLWNAFYALADGTPFTLDYAFRVDAMPSGPIDAMIEMARNLDAIALNGQPLTIAQVAAEGGCFDFSYDRVPLPGLRLGENVLTLTGKKCNNITGMANHAAVPRGEAHRPTELEAVYLAGRFAVAQGGRDPVVFGDCPDRVRGDFTKAGLPYYAGEARYAVRIPQDAAFLELDADASAATLDADGARQTAFLRPYTFDVSALRGREAVITLYGNLANSHGPAHLRERDTLAMLGPALMYNRRLYQERAVLIPFGLHEARVYGDVVE